MRLKKAWSPSVIPAVIEISERSRREYSLHQWVPAYLRCLTIVERYLDTGAPLSNAKLALLAGITVANLRYITEMNPSFSRLVSHTQRLNGVWDRSEMPKGSLLNSSKHAPV